MKCKIHLGLLRIEKMTSNLSTEVLAKMIRPVSSTCKLSTVLLKKENLNC